MKQEKLIELFVECYNNCGLNAKITIHNTYERENGYGYENVIERNDEDFFNLFFEGKPMEAVRATFFGDYRYADDWVWFNAYGNLNSGDYEEQLPLRDGEEMAEWYIDNYDEVRYFEEMVDVCEACENGDDEDEDDEGEENDDEGKN